MGKHIKSFQKKKNSLRPNTASHNNASWYTDPDGFLEHSSFEENLYLKGPTLQKIIPFWGSQLYKILFQLFI